MLPAVGTRESESERFGNPLRVRNNGRWYEATIDYISTEKHPLAKAAKDTGSAAVAVMGFGYIVTWVFALLALF
ncbi:MAG: diacylglycerol kinase [bacterium]|nr:diacylglycerol kinase [bacterium]